MRLSRTIAYAIHATLQLADGEQGVPIPCSQLASEGKMPERFLLQILRSLVTHGLLCSSRGVDGGYYLARSPDEISLSDIVQAFDNPLSPSIPELDALAPDVRRHILATLSRAATAAHAELRQLTVGQLARVERSGG